MLTCHFLREQNNKVSFLDVNVISEQDKFITSANEKLFGSFLHDTYKIGIIYNLVNRCFWICSSWSIFHIQLILLREIFQKNGFSENFIDRCFKLFLNRIHILKEKVPTVEKNLLQLVLLYLGAISVQTGTKLRKSIKGSKCLKLQVVLKCQNKFCNSFCYKDPVPQIFASVVYKF